MIFHRKHLRAIARGVKTETRRLVKPGETKPYYRATHTYTLQPGRGMHGVGIRVKVLNVEKQSLWMLTNADANAEGYTNREEYIAEYIQINARRFNADNGEVTWAEKNRLRESKVWAIRFKVTEVNLLEVDDDLLEHLLYHPRWRDLTERQMLELEPDEFNWVHTRVSAVDPAGFAARNVL